jgi:hypothetical protein
MKTLDSTMKKNIKAAAKTKKVLNGKTTIESINELDTNNVRIFKNLHKSNPAISNADALATELGKFMKLSADKQKLYLKNLSDLRANKWKAVKETKITNTIPQTSKIAEKANLKYGKPFPESAKPATAIEKTPAKKKLITIVKEEKEAVKPAKTDKKPVVSAKTDQTAKTESMENLAIRLYNAKAKEDTIMKAFTEAYKTKKNITDKTFISARVQIYMYIAETRVKK